MIRRILSTAGIEIRIAIRNRWVAIAIALMVVFALVLSAAGSAPTGQLGVDRLSVTVASLTSLSVYLVPLVALLMSFDAVAGEVERGTLPLLLTYPAARGEVLAGKGLAHLAVLTLALDALKGYVPVVVALMLQQPLGLSKFAVAMVGLAAFVGHLWPVFFRFRGGKGVATAAGVLLALNPLLGLATLASWALIVGFMRYVSLGSIVAAVFAPFYQLLIWGGGAPLLAIVPMSLLLIWRHAANIRKLLAGTESRLGQKVPEAQAKARSAPAGRRRKPRR